MNRPSRSRTLLAALLLGSAVSLPGLQLAQAVAPQVTHAAPASQAGPILAGIWANDAKGARFAQLEVHAVANGGVDGGLPDSYTYSLYAFSVPLNRYVAYGTAAPVPYAAAATAAFRLTALPTPSRFVRTTLALTWISLAVIKVAISDYYSGFGPTGFVQRHSTSTEYMYNYGWL